MLGVYTILEVGEQGWGSTQTLVLGAVSIALLAAFVARQARIANPLMPLRLFRSRNVTGANLVMALLVVGFFGMFFLGALYLQGILGYSALEVGLAFLPSCIVMGTLSLGYRGAPDHGLRRRGRTLIAGLVVRRGRAAAVRARAGRRQLRDGRPAGDAAARRRRRPLLPGADDARDVGRHAQRLRAGLGARQHDGPGRRRDRPRGARDARDRAHRQPARRRRVGGRGAQRRLPPRLPDRRRAGRDRHRGGGDRAAPRGAGGAKKPSTRRPKASAAAGPPTPKPPSWPAAS